MKTTKSRVRKLARISVNKLSDYLISTAHSRKTIIKDQKHPKPFKTAYYQPAENTIINYFVSGGRNNSIIDTEIKHLRSLRNLSDYQKKRNDSNILALKNFSNTIDEIINLEDYSITRGNTDVEKLEIAGVKISVRPEVILTSKSTNHDDIGVIKLFFSKNNPLDEEMGDYITTITHQWVKNNLKIQKCNTPNELTFVLDVFNGKIFTTPKAFKQRLKDVKAACEEINIMWPHM